MNKKLTSREKLLQAAQEHLLEKGATDFTVRAIASRAGVNHGLVHHYFGSMEGLTTELLRHFAEQKFAQVASSLEEAQGCHSELCKSAGQIHDPVFAKLFLAFFQLGDSMPCLCEAHAEIANQRRRQIAHLLGLGEQEARILQSLVIGGLILSRLDPGFNVGLLMELCLTYFQKTEL